MLKFFKILALLEGLSLLALLFFAVPMKHIYGEPVFVRVIGMAHGVLFIAYIIFAAMLRPQCGWKLRIFVIVLVASVIPFGTFYVERKYLNTTG